MLVGGARLACLALERREAMRAAPRPPQRAVIAAAGASRCALRPWRWSLPAAATPDRPPALTIRILDVGQGDAILVQPRDHPPLLVDTGPPDGEAGERLADLGIEELSALAITHDELDHSGGLAGVLEEVDVNRILASYGPPGSCRYLDCPPTTGVAAGSRFRLGRARVEVLWPPATASGGREPE